MKVLLLAPIQVPAGGIHAWAKLLLQERCDQSIEYIIVDTSVHYRTLGGRMGIRGAVCAVWDCVTRFLAMVRCLVKDRPDLVYFTCAPSIGFAFRDTPLIVLSKLFGRKVVSHLHGGNVEGFWGGNVLKRILAKIGTRLSDYIFVITRECEQVAREKFGNAKVVYVPNFINVNAPDEVHGEVPVEIKRDRFNLLHVAFQCKIKGTFEVIQAARYVDGVNVLLIGPVADENRQAIDDAIVEHGVQDKVTLVGPMHKPKLWDYYRSADVFLFPTHKKGPEGFPNVIMEAMLCRLPIITTDVGNIAEMVDAEGQKPAALMLKNSDPPSAEEIAGLINRLKVDKSLRDQLARNGYSRVVHYYSTGVIIPAFERILRAVNNNENVLSVSSGFFFQRS